MKPYIVPDTPTRKHVEPDAIDWPKQDAVIARELGMHRSTIRAARKRLGIPKSPNHGHNPGNRTRGSSRRGGPRRA